MPEFKVTVVPYERENSNIKGLARVYFEDSFVVGNINILQGKEKVFVAMPSYKTKQVDDNGKAVYQDICYPVTKVKADMRTKAISIVNDVKAKGMSALNRVAELTGIKWKLKSVDEKIKGGITDTEQTIERIENFTVGMKIANAQYANSFRALVGKDDKELVGADKKGLVTKLLTGPWKWQKNVYEGMCRNIEGMVKRLDNLSMEVRSRDAGRSVEAEAVDTEVMDYEEIDIGEPGDSVLKVAEEDKYEVVVRNGKGR